MIERAEREHPEHRRCPEQSRRDAVHGAITAGGNHNRRMSAGGSGGLSGILSMLQFDDQGFEPGGEEQSLDVGLTPVSAEGAWVQQNGDHDV
jgi:hypothetical protein